jgi:hypothetical protein
MLWRCAHQHLHGNDLLRYDLAVFQARAAIGARRTQAIDSYSSDRGRTYWCLVFNAVVPSRGLVLALRAAYALIAMHHQPGTAMTQRHDFMKQCPSLPPAAARSRVSLLAFVKS